ncbi:3-oxoacyl-ACP synthase [Halogeometricum borinquense]|uniref:3-oxoacyl-ACP synthase n=1 Tax=Halogeometricum borinquense TaxID=60847 RepID=A0A6C0UP20_9EURY|nr:3-oxoacyl-ACP synthase [Halogeometricum borinquense]QIB74688.1 3-oxoacyl-ACP synthase [Halogeometricum borinquense]QIQ76357.1 3-oxoacyl-ACP synthase [Halogeometricum borinquense]
MHDVHLTGFGTYVPDETVTGEQIADRSGIPETVVVEKMGIREKHVCLPDDDHVSDMSVVAAEKAIADAGCSPGDLDLVLYHGSEYKDYVVWNAAAHVAERIGADNAYAHESYTLCAGAPVAIRHTAAQLRTGDIDTALLLGASREEDLVDYDNDRSSFMFNFGSGASAMVLESTAIESVEERSCARVLKSAAVTDGRFALDVILPAGGSKHPPSDETVSEGLHTLDVPNHESMKERLAAVSLPNFLTVADDALEASGYDRTDLDFVALTHMKRSFHELLIDELGVGSEGSYYLDAFGHAQSADQILAIDAALDSGDGPTDGDVVLFLAAGTGYTWAATVLEWRA